MQHGQLPCHGQYPSLAGGVRDLRCRRPQQGHEGGRVDDGAAPGAPQGRDAVLAAQEHPLEVDLLEPVSVAVILTHQVVGSHIGSLHPPMIDDPKIKRLLKRILADEESHHGDFEHFVEKAAREGAEDQRGKRKDDVTKILNWGIEHEYTVVLQYMFHSYMTEDPEVKKQLEDQAINEMQHLGWLAEELVDGSGTPVIEHTQPDQSTDTVDMLEADIKIEKEVAEAYDRAAKDTEDKDLKKLLLRIRDNERYHIEVFNDLLDEEEEEDSEFGSNPNIADSGG